VDNQVSDKNHGTSHVYSLHLSSAPDLFEIGISAPSEGLVTCSQSVASVASLSLQVDHNSFAQQVANIN